MSMHRVTVFWGWTFHAFICSYWRTTYSEHGWATFLKREAQLPLEDVVCLIDDAFALANANLVPSSLPLRIISAVAYRASYPVWVTAIGHLRAWSRLLSTSPPPNAIRSMVARIMPEVGDAIHHNHMFCSLVPVT